MKNIEIILAALGLVGLSLSLLLIPGGNILSILSLGLFSMLYSIFGFAIFNCIRFRNIAGKGAFKGLKASEAFSIENYVHFREPKLKENIELNLRKEGIYNHDFLDNAREDLPMGQWTILKDTLGKTAIVRSKLWPGFYGFHQVNTDSYGGCYIGNGCKAVDIPFMF